MLGFTTSLTTDTQSTQLSFVQFRQAQVLDTFCAFMQEFARSTPGISTKDNELAHFQLLNSVHSVLAREMTEKLLPEEYSLFNQEVLHLMRQYASRQSRPD